MRAIHVWMTGIVLVMGMAAPMPAAASAPAAVTEADRAAIVSVIRHQLEAFRADRGVEAFAYASPGVQRQFGTPERFMEMVRTGYRPVYRPRSVHFLDLVTAGGGAPTQRVLVLGPDGAAVLALYSMERQPAGEWRISGCVLQRLAERDA